MRVWNRNEKQRVYLQEIDTSLLRLTLERIIVSSFIEKVLILSIHICIIDTLKKGRRSKALWSKAGNILERRRERYKEFQTVVRDSNWVPEIKVCIDFKFTIVTSE
jgi:hypothetical protein